jgi:hypothetical protein
VQEDAGRSTCAYSDAMRSVWKKYPKDKDVGALFADRLHESAPVGPVVQRRATPSRGTGIQATIEAVLKMDPKHPYGVPRVRPHMEASPHAEKALAAPNVCVIAYRERGHSCTCRRTSTCVSVTI